MARAAAVWIWSEIPQGWISTLARNGSQQSTSALAKATARQAADSKIRNVTGGEGGIRTLGTLLRYGALAKRCFRPLSHLTNRMRE